MKRSFESFSEQLERVELMATGSPTWDLSDNDIQALRAVLADRRKLLLIVKSEEVGSGK